MRSLAAAMAVGTLCLNAALAQNAAPPAQRGTQPAGPSVNTTQPPKTPLSSPAEMPSAAGAGAAPDTTTQNSVASVNANVFAQRAQMSNAFEIESSQIAARKSKTERIREFAQMIMKDHVQASNFMQQALAKANAVAGVNQTTVTQLDGPHRELLAQLERAEGSEFDRLYVELQTKAHEDAVKLFELYAKTGDDPALKKFAADMLPVLQRHLEQVKQLPTAT